MPEPSLALPDACVRFSPIASAEPAPRGQARSNIHARNAAIYGGGRNVARQHGGAGDGGARAAMGRVGGVAPADESLITQQRTLRVFSRSGNDYSGPWASVSVSPSPRALRRPTFGQPVPTWPRRARARSRGRSASCSTFNGTDAADRGREETRAQAWGGGSSSGSLDAKMAQRCVDAEGLDQLHELRGTAHQEINAEVLEFVRGEPGCNSHYPSTMQARHDEAPPGHQRARRFPALQEPSWLQMSSGRWPRYDVPHA